MKREHASCAQIKLIWLSKLLWRQSGLNFGLAHSENIWGGHTQRNYSEKHLKRLQIYLEIQNIRVHISLFHQLSPEDNEIEIIVKNPFLTYVEFVLLSEMPATLKILKTGFQKMSLHA